MKTCPIIAKRVPDTYKARNAWEDGGTGGICRALILEHELRCLP
jgi:hypothetical protein